MPRITANVFVQAFSKSPELATRLAQAIDGGGQRSRANGVLSVSEISAALRAATTTGYDSAALRDGFTKLFGAEVLTSPRGAELIAQKVSTEAAVGGVTEKDLLKDLQILCKDPSMSVREAASPDYVKAAGFVADELKKAGVKPLGDKKNGEASYFQAFRWDDRFAPGTIAKSSNVVGVLPGKGKEPREAVLVIAHLDNLSRAEKDWYARNEGRQLRRYEGANDNTASVAALLEVARGLQAAGGNQRDVIFLVPSAEEDGLKGTEAFVKAPPVPLDRIVGAVNLEMIGRNATSELLLYGGATTVEAKKNPLYARAERIANASGTAVKAGPDNDDGQGWYERSDHLVTQNAGIPSIMFHGRTTEGNYHTDDDTVENLNMEKVRVVGQQVLRVVRDLANDERPAERRGPAKPTVNPFPGRVWPGE